MPSRGGTTARGYGYQHQAKRDRWKPKVAAGQVRCWRCKLHIQSGQKWDLGHDDYDRTKYRGPEHALAKDCPAGGNRATAGRRGANPNTGTVYIVTGPPASGKSTWVKQHAKIGDVTIDYDALANTLTPPNGGSHQHEPHIRSITKAARRAAIDAALTAHGDHDVYIIHSLPGRSTIDRYLQLGAKIVTIDPGQDVVMARIKAERPWQMQQAAKEWYAASKHAGRPSNHGGGSAALDFFATADQHNRRSEAQSDDLDHATSGFSA